MHCSIARTFGALGDGWSALILRDVFVGLNRFEDLRADLGISRKILTARLKGLEEAGILVRIAYQERPLRYEHRLSVAGEELIPPILALLAWGDRWKQKRDGPPALIYHRGHKAHAKVACDVCGEVWSARELSAAVGPGGKKALGTKKIGAWLRKRA
jgi:DNA-binding HxlR family transcriptional regulator